MEKPYIIGFVVVITSIVIEYFIIKSNKYLKEEYQHQKNTLRLKGLIVNKKYFQDKGWKYREKSYITTFFGSIMFIVLVFIL